MATKYQLPKIEELLNAGVHFGHQLKRWHPKMEQYIYTSKKNIHILDLENTMSGLDEACKVLYETAKKGGQIVFVGTKKQAREIVEIEAKRSGALYVTDRWLGGTFTNYKIIKKNIDKLLTFIKRKETGDLDRYTKKERLMIDREIEKLLKSVGGIVALKGVPEALFIIDVKREKTAIREAVRCGVPVVALVDTNSDPTDVKYVIPGNDDAIKSVALIVKAVADAVEAGYQDFNASKDEPKEVLVSESSVEAVEEVVEVASKEVKKKTVKKKAVAKK